MWTVVYIAPSRSAANSLKTILEKEGLLVALRPVGKTLKEQNNGVEILVPETEVEEAHEILSESISK